MPHRGLQFDRLEILSDRIRIHTRRDSEGSENGDLNLQMHGTGACFDDPYFKAGILEFIPWSDRIIQTRFTESDFVDGEREFICAKPEFTGWKVDEAELFVALETTSIKVRVSKATCAIEWLDDKGNTIVREPESGGKSLQRQPIEKYANDGSAEVVEVETVDGKKKRLVGGNMILDRMAYRSTLRLSLDSDEAIYGLGQHEEGILNYRNARQFLYQANMKIAIPTLVSSKGYAIHFDHHSLSTYQADEEGMLFWSDCVDQLDFFFVYGPEIDDVVAGLRELTGEMPMLPRWAYGFVQSKERYETQEELCEVVQRYRDEKVPIDCIVLDWESWESELWGQKTFDASRFPEPGKMMDRIHEMDARLMISIWPIMHGESPNKIEMREAGFLMANGANYDTAIPEARELYWKQMNEGLFSKGIDAWWCDCTEPFEADWNGTFHRPDWERMNLCVNEFKNFMDPSEINVYSTRHSRGIYEGQRSVTERKRVVNLTRSAAPSQQRYGTIAWSGDVEARWSRLRKQLADGLNFVITGNPRWTFDIGAFFVKPGVPWFWDGEYTNGYQDLGYRELYTRWYQAGTFLPMFRSHGTDTPREIWRFGEAGTMFYDTIKAYTELRYRLLPYIYSLAAKEVFEGYTMFRNLVFDFRHDPDCRDISDQFMFGPSLMICPVLEPMYFDKDSEELHAVSKKRRVYLPAGNRWFDFWTSAVYEGGQWVEMDAPIEKMPILVREGTLIPMGPVTQHTGENLEAAWEVHVYGEQDASFNVYEDSGDSYDYEKGDFCWTKLNWDHSEQKLSRVRGAGGYSGFTMERELSVVLHR